MEEDKVDCTCSAYGGGERRMHNFCWKNFAWKTNAYMLG